MNTGSRGVNSAVREEGGTSLEFSSQMPVSRLGGIRRSGFCDGCFEQINTLSMTMKNYTLNRSLLWMALLALVSASGIVLWAGDKNTERDPLVLKSDRKPLDRDETLRVSYSSVLKKTSPSVVYVFSSKTVKTDNRMAPYFNDPIFRRFFGVPDQPNRQMPRERKQQGLGSGVIISSDGYILTNNHVIDGADEVKVAFGDTQVEFEAKVIGRDPKTDIAVLKIDAEDLPAATLADSDGVEVGDTVFAIGNPFGIGMTVTHGIVSAIGRGGLRADAYENFIQTDAAINPGNSGGALVDSQGRLIGINTAILSRSGGFNGVGFAIPVNTARSLAEQLVSTGKISRGFIGVRTQGLTPELAEQFQVKHGALVTEVSPDSPAEEAGFQSGDIITKVNGKDVLDPRRLQLAVITLAPGTEVEVEFVRDGKTKMVEFALGELPMNTLAGGDAYSDDDVGVLNGVGVTDITPQIRQQFRLPKTLEGAFITSVDPDSAAGRVGIREGDVLLSLDRQRVLDASEAVELSEEIEGPKVLVHIWREGYSRYIVVDESEK